MINNRYTLESEVHKLFMGKKHFGKCLNVYIMSTALYKIIFFCFHCQSIIALFAITFSPTDMVTSTLVIVARNDV